MANRTFEEVYIIVLELTKHYALRNFLRNRKMYLERKFRDLK